MFYPVRRIVFGRVFSLEVCIIDADRYGCHDIVIRQPLLVLPMAIKPFYDRDRLIMERRFANKQEKAILYIWQDGKCAVCCAQLPDSFDADHIIAWCNGGKTELKNLQGVCRRCHKRKTADDVRLHRERVNAK